MASSSWSSARRLRRHGTSLQPPDRRDLERAGWRTTLEFRENHVRAADGTLIEVVPAWTAEAERYDSGLAYASAIGASVEEAWSTLRADIAADRATSTSRIRLLRA